MKKVRPKPYLTETKAYWRRSGIKLLRSVHVFLGSVAIVIKLLQSRTKEQYLSRAVEVQPVFNRDVISDLSDQASASLLDCAAWAEGEEQRFSNALDGEQSQSMLLVEQTEAESDLLDFLYRGDLQALQGLLSHYESSPASAERVTRAFLTAVSQASEAALDALLGTGLVDWHSQDDINDRNCLHKVAMAGRRKYVLIALQSGTDPSSIDAYGRIPLHYAAMNGHTLVVEDLIHAKRDTVDMKDLESFTPLIHGIVHGRLESVEKILSFSPNVNRIDEAGHIPLNLACQHGCLEIASLLLQQKPQIIPDAEGLFPQHLVARCGSNPNLFSLLQEYGADLNQPDKLYGWTPLFHAASEGRVDCLKMLLSHGVSTDVRDEKGQPALYYATWEGHLQCMDLLPSASIESTLSHTSPHSSLAQAVSQQSVSSGSSLEQIPDLSLPPPIIPTRRYGHNFLASKSNVLIMFNEDNSKAVRFFDESKYPAARLTMTPRSPDILPRNLLLPIQDDYRYIAFETDDLANFALEFDVYPTFGKRVLAKGSVPAEVFRTGQRSSGYYYLSLFDPRLRAVGQMSFKFQVIKPFNKLPVSSTSLDTYWKATSQLESKPSLFVTDSSLSGDYLRISIQSSQDLVPVGFPDWWYVHYGLSLPISHLNYEAFQSTSSNRASSDSGSLHLRNQMDKCALLELPRVIYDAHLSLDDILKTLPTGINLDIHILYPTEQQEDDLHVGPTPNINNFADAVLDTVFRHTRRTRHAHVQSRSIMFSSYNADFCTALNWKQPNCKFSIDTELDHVLNILFRPCSSLQ